LYVSEFQLYHSLFGLYADDLIIWKSKKDIALLQSLIHQDIRLVKRFSSAFGFPISNSKTEAIIFTNFSRDPPNSLHIFSSEIPYCNSVKLLGLCIDSKMLWHADINSLKFMIIRRLCVPKRLAGRKWGCHPKVILDFYKSYIRPYLEYGIQFFSIHSSSASKPWSLYKILPFKLLWVRTGTLLCLN
jgi:hypothetical protein